MASSAGPAQPKLAHVWLLYQNLRVYGVLGFPPTGKTQLDFRGYLALPKQEPNIGDFVLRRRKTASDVVNELPIYEHLAPEPRRHLHHGFRSGSKRQAQRLRQDVDEAIEPTSILELIKREREHIDAHSLECGRSLRVRKKAIGILVNHGALAFDVNPLLLPEEVAVAAALQRERLPAHVERHLSRQFHSRPCDGEIQEEPPSGPRRERRPPP